MSDTTGQISWIKSLLGEIGFSRPKVLLYCDNQGVIFLATNPAQEQQSKHIGIRYLLRSLLFSSPRFFPFFT